ncbi:hypothetical protein PIB30_050803 [Stylosanthes scabra]|uniref:Uncharacterized protein n=1 Tax=Stylosanthes scabra TaxID=79078 RepID=A0ABU6RIA8_9FABA|nr:hypothetical protein [Stylosanthes scabra]
MDVLHPLVPKVEELQEDQPPPVLEQPSQMVVEVVLVISTHFRFDSLLLYFVFNFLMKSGSAASCRKPIYPTQEVIDVSSSSEDERPPLIPKTEEYHAYSPSARIITEVLMSMNRDEAPSFDLGIDPPLPQREEAPSFDLGIDPPLLTTQDHSDIEELDELVKKAKDQFQTPQPKKSLENQKELEEKVVTWVTVPKGENKFETIFKLAGDMFLEAMRYQFQSMAPKTYIDIQVITIMCHILNNEQNERFEKFVYSVPPEIMVNPVRSPPPIKFLFA